MKSALQATMTNAICAYLRSQLLLPMVEYALPNGRRLDVAALGRKGYLLGVEIKTSESDFNRDLKWSDAAQFCFLFYIAVPHGFNVSLIHPGIRVITVVDGVAHISRRMGKGLLSPHEWQHARGRYAVNVPGARSPLRSDPTGDARRARVWMP